MRSRASPSPPVATIIASPSGHTLPLPSQPLSPSIGTGPSVQYRVEERRRTVYVTTDMPPSEWSSETVSEILKLADVPEEEPGAADVRRAHSLSEREFLVYQESPNQTRLEVSDPPSRQSLHSSKRKSQVTLRPTFSPTPPNTPLRGPVHTGPRSRILFYHKHNPHYGFTNFSPHPVIYKGKKYPTSEHLFQSFKFQGHRPVLAEHIRTCSERPSVAFSEARRFQPEVRSDWMQVNVEKMDEALWHKFTQHPDLKQELLATGEAELVEDSDKDAFWGVGADRKGRNELGKALERLRAKLREV